MKIGVFICHCGHNIKQTVDIKALVDFFDGFPFVSVSKDYPFLCSEPGQRLIKQSIEEKRIERVIIAACTPSLHGPLFRDLLKRSGLNPYLLKIASIREHCSWVGDDIKKNTEKAKSLILSSLFALYQFSPLEERKIELKSSALVVGGGISGMSAALFLSKMGIKVFLLEKEGELGGHLLKVSVWPEEKQGREIIKEIEKKIEEEELVEVIKKAKIKAFEGSFGDYMVKVERDGEEKEIRVGGVIVAIGFRPFDPKERRELFYGRDERIMTTLEFEEKFERLNLKEDCKVAIFHCIGSRDKSLGKPYCSRICCINALKVAKKVKERYRKAYVESFYMDMRAHPRGGEEFYEEVQKMGVIFTRANISEVVPEKEGLLIKGEDTLLNEVFERRFDLVVLSIGISPPEDARNISSLLKLSLDKDGFFLEAHPKLKPFETAIKGVFIAGCCSGPKDVLESINHGRSAALKLFSLLYKGYAFSEPTVAHIDEKRCSGCRICERICVFKAIEFHEERRKAKVEELICAGCGLCANNCPSSAITLKGFTDTAILEEISGLLEEPWSK